MSWRSCSSAQAWSFVSPATGYVLGAVGCTGLPCPARLVATSDGGKRWHFLTAPDVRLVGDSGTGRGAAVSNVTFASLRDGWLYSPGLWSTSDGGAHWRELSLGGAIMALDASPGTAYAVVAPRGGGRWELFSSPAGRGAWVRAGTMTGNPYATSLAVSGQAAWFGTGTDLWATADGVHWHRYPFACPSAYYQLQSIAAASPSHVVFLCAGDAGMGSEAKEVLTSSDGGRTVRLAGQAPLYGIGGTIAVPPHRGNVITLATGQATSTLDGSADGGKTWTQVKYPSTGAGWDSLSYVSRTAGWVVLGSPDRFGSHFNRLLRTSDAGRTWHEVGF